MSRAAVDVGSNSVRVKVVDDAGHELARDIAITRLARGVDRTGRLDDEALRATLDVIARFRDLWVRHGVSDVVRIAATSAVRDAEDRDRFFDGVRELTGVDAEVLTGEQEAATAYRGVRAGLEAPLPFAVLDIGGGSTEVIVGAGDGSVAGSSSMQLGSVRLTERYLGGDPPGRAEVAAANQEIHRRLTELDRELAGQQVAVVRAATLVGVAGTVTTLAALDARIDTYVDGCVHGQVVSPESLRRWADELCSLTAAQIATFGPVQDGREDVIAGGALIAAAVVERYGFPGLVVSESDLLDGLALG